MEPDKTLTVPGLCTNETQIELAGDGWDDMRELGHHDLRLNYPEINRV